MIYPSIIKHSNKLDYLYYPVKGVEPMINKRIFSSLILFATALLDILALAACGGGATSAPENLTQTSGEPVKLILGAYTTPREAFGELIPIFQKQWKEKTGQDVL
jgi:sulfate transport system substrate-binding protein